MVFVQKWPLFPPVFLGNIGQDNVFYNILEQKNACLGYRKKTLKKSKNWHFSKRGYLMVLVQKWPFFQSFFFRQNSPGKCLLRYSSTKKAFLGYRNKKFKKLKNWHFSKGVKPWFWSKNGHFSKLFFLGNRGKENVFYDILQRKNSFLGYKNKKFKKSKNWHFSKLFFLGNIGQENVVYDILQQKKLVSTL